MLKVLLNINIRGVDANYSGEWGFSPTQKLRKTRVDFGFSSSHSYKRRPKLQNCVTRLPIPNLFCASLVAALAFAGCATQQPRPKFSPARAELNAARKNASDPQTAAGFYLDAADKAAAMSASPGKDTADARAIYNTACGELTVLLRSSRDLWNHTQTIRPPHGPAYRLRFQPGTHDQVWAPDYFTAFTPADRISERRIRKPDRRDGVGGELVGFRHPATPDPFVLPGRTLASPVTATLDFHGRDAVLSLQDPRSRSTVRVLGAARPLAADFSAPLASYRPVSELWVGFMAAIRADHYIGRTGLYFSQPYDPDRIPVIFVHGLVSTPQMWLNVVNEINSDPVLRARYQYWVFSYPTGNPIAWSALRLREELAKVQRVYPGHRPYVLVGHSLGGLVVRMQATTIDRADWVRTEGKQAGESLDRMPPGSIVHRSLVFDANPHIGRIIFISTPHRGSNMAIGSIGELAMRLITLPASLAGTITNQIGGDLTGSGASARYPNSIYNLSPRNPLLNVMDKLPIRAPHHSIIGDRGRGGTPHSSDGVVEYWSSHLDSAQSELIVPAPHTCCEYPQTIAEIRRILLLNLKTDAGAARP